jgi:branched-chain amino acid transport system substrate-binding protein
MMSISRGSARGTRRHRRLWSLLLTAPLFLTSCGSDNAGTGVGGGAATIDIRGTATGSPIVLYTIIDQDTSLQNEPEIYAAAQAAALAINNSGGIKGHRVDIRTCNEQAQANIAADCARRVVSERAVALVGYATVYGDTIDPILAQAKIPSVGNVPDQAEDLRSPISYPFQASIGDAVAGVAMQYAAMNYTKIGLLLLNNPLAEQLAAQVETVVGKIKTADGRPITTTKVAAPLSAADYTPFVASLQKEGAQGVVLLTAPSAGGAAISAARQAGYDMTFGSTESAFTVKAVLGSLGDAAEGFISTSSLPNPLSDASLPGLAKFKADMAAAEKAGLAHTSGDDLNAFSLNAWLSVYAVQEAAASITGDVTNASLITALDSAKDLRLEGLTPPWTPAKAGPPSEPRISNGTVYASVYKNGKYSLLQTTPLDVGALLSR